MVRIVTKLIALITTLKRIKRVPSPVGSAFSPRQGSRASQQTSTSVPMEAIRTTWLISKPLSHAFLLRLSAIKVSYKSEVNLLKAQLHI